MPDNIMSWMSSWPKDIRSEDVSREKATKMKNNEIRLIITLK